jgi:arsenate reductase (thioredoxin)
MTSRANSNVKFYDPLQMTIDQLIEGFDLISGERKNILKQLADFIERKQSSNEKIQLIFICTHNSRRSHISQIWSQAAAAYYGIKNVTSYSGGTEATAFNPRAVRAIETVGFKIRKNDNSVNPTYEVSFSQQVNPIVTFSKTYDADTNPHERFAAIMTCSHADENCPVVAGMEKRISLPYNDPKDFDGTNLETEKYLERVKEIGREILYAFSIVNRV